MESRRIEKEKKQVSNGEKPGVEKTGKEGKYWIKTAKGFVTTVTCSSSEIRVEVETHQMSSAFYW